jgi:aminopeptidase N
LAVRNKFPIVSGRQLRQDAVYNGDLGPGNDIYYKASNVLHTLRTLIGDEAFFKITRLAVYGRDDPKPGNFTPRYMGSRDFVKIVNQVIGKDLGWFFDVYLYDAAAPELVEVRDDGDLLLSWKTSGGKPFPMPVDVKIGDRLVTLPMTDGTGRVTVGEAAPVIVDPASKILRRQPYVEAYQVWRATADKAASEARKKAAEDKAAAEKK